MLHDLLTCTPYYLPCHVAGGRQKTSNTNDLTSRDNQTGTDPPGHESSTQKLTPTPQEACEKLDLKDPLPRSPKKENRIIMQPSRRHKFTSSTRRVVSPRGGGRGKPRHLRCLWRNGADDLFPRYPSPRTWTPLAITSTLLEKQEGRQSDAACLNHHN